MCVIINKDDEVNEEGSFWYIDILREERILNAPLLFFYSSQ